MGKTQLAEDVKKPAALFLDSKVSFANPEDVEEIQDELKSIEKARQREGIRATKVSKFLQDNWFRTDKTWPFLYHKGYARQLSVKFFFPKKNLAIDQFRNPTKMDLAEVDFKRKLFAEHKIKYFPMFPQHKLMDLYDFL